VLVIGHEIQNRSVHGRLQGGLAQRAGHLEGNFRTRHREHHLLLAQGLHLIQGIHAPRAFDPIIAAELLIHAKIPNGFAKHGIRNVSQQRELLG